MMAALPGKKIEKNEYFFLFYYYYFFNEYDVEMFRNRKKSSSHFLFTIHNIKWPSWDNIKSLVV